MTKTNKQSLSDIIEIDGVKYQRVEEPEPQMNLVDDGTFTKVSYNGRVYYRTESKLSAFWWLVQKNRDVARPNVLVMVMDTETEQLLEGVYRNNIVVKKKQEPEPEPKTKTLSLKQLLMKWEFEFSTKWENPKNRNSELYDEELERFIQIFTEWMPPTCNSFGEWRPDWNCGYNHYRGNLMRKLK